MKKHLFIVTYGRTGSTLLMGLLNSCDKICLHGENFGLFLKSYDSLKVLDQIKRQQDQITQDTSENPFFGVSKFPIKHVQEQILNIMDSCLPQGDFETVGFKEVRYDIPDLENYLTFIRERYQNSQFIFLTRENSSTASSGFFKNGDKQLVIKHLDLIKERFDSYTSKHSDITYKIDYTDLLDFKSVNRLFEFLGYSIDTETWTKVLSTRHSYDQKVALKISSKSSLILFDQIEKLLLSHNFDTSGQQWSNMTSLKLKGLLLPTENSGQLKSLLLRNGEDSHHAKIGIPSPKMVTRFPDSPFSSHARFDFNEHGPPMQEGPKDYDLIATFANIGEVTIGRLFVAAPTNSEITQ